MSAKVSSKIAGFAAVVEKYNSTFGTPNAVNAWFNSA
jgi:hypothetical protein